MDKRFQKRARIKSILYKKKKIIICVILFLISKFYLPICFCCCNELMVKNLFN